MGYPEDLASWENSDDLQRTDFRINDRNNKQLGSPLACSGGNFNPTCIAVTHYGKHMNEEGHMNTIVSLDRKFKEFPRV